MAVPKNRHSKSRTNKRRSQWKLDQVAIGLCSECKEPKQPHRVCRSCGSYRGQKVNEVDKA